MTSASRTGSGVSTFCLGMVPPGSGARWSSELLCLGLTVGTTSDIRRAFTPPPVHLMRVTPVTVRGRWSAAGPEPEILDAGPPLEEFGGKSAGRVDQVRSEEHTSELQSLMRISYA